MIQFTPKTDEMLDIDEMTLEQLQTYKEDLLRQIAELDTREPKNMNSEAYEAWGEEHEELEDLLDEVLDLIEEQS